MNKNLGKTKFFKRTSTTTLITLIMVIAFFSICNIVIENELIDRVNALENLLIPLCYYIILAVSLNLIVGILGELSLGQAGFMCIGAYSSAVFSMLTAETISSDLLRYCLAILVGGLCASIFGLIIGFSVLRLRGDYLAIVTLAFGEITYKLIQNCYLIKDKNGLHFSFAKSINPSKIDFDSQKKILDGAQAISKVPKVATLISSVVLVLITIVVMYHLIDSRAGRAFKAIRDNSIAAESIGINVNKYKLIVFFISAFFAGISGVIYSHYQTLDKANKFDFNLSILVLVFVVLGGLGSIRGSVVATVILVLLPEILRSFQSYRMVVYALILIIMMILTNNDKCKEVRAKLKDKLRSKFVKSKE